MEAWILSLLGALALPRYGLSTVFVVAFVSATLLPMGSEPAVFGLVKLNESLFWPAVLVATLGNTLGGMVSWWMGAGAQHAVHRWRAKGEGISGAEYMAIGKFLRYTLMTAALLWVFPQELAL
ncbi:MAG: DedA family protein [Betaproteobacteria bacterium]|nr:DedA family protein [Betaproteobacteria bacterium]